MIGFTEKGITAVKAENKPKTLEELFIEQFLELKEHAENTATAWHCEREQHTRLQTVIDTLKEHATLENGAVCIIITECQKRDRDFIVKALELKEGEKTNE